MVAITAEGHNVHLQFTPKLAEDWKNAISAGVNLEIGNYPNIKYCKTIIIFAFPFPFLPHLRGY